MIEVFDEAAMIFSTGCGVAFLLFLVVACWIGWIDLRILWDKVSHPQKPSA